MPERTESMLGEGILQVVIRTHGITRTRLGILRGGLRACI